jgi:acyl-CoA thioesterase FadM
MYPFLRLALTLARESRRPRIGFFDTHHLPLRCLPWDLDIFAEMNNGRILTLYDLGRTALTLRTGFAATARRRRWGFVVAGSSVRYRKRLRAFDRFDLRTRIVGWDARFIYIEQAMWQGETCCNHALLRTGVTHAGRLVALEAVLAAIAEERAPPVPPDLPAWVRAWAEADAQRPWPPGL